jgi:hypothetical protein
LRVLLALKLVVVHFFLFSNEIVVVVLGDNQYLLELSVVYQGINDLATLCGWKFRHFNAVDLLQVSMSIEEPPINS